MNGAEVRRLDDRQLVEGLVEKKEELFNLRFQRATGQLENTARITRTKRDIARLRTVLREREIAAADALVAGEGR